MKDRELKKITITHNDDGTANVEWLYGHLTRMSDSSLYDEVCVVCGATDREPRFKQPCARTRVTRGNVKYEFVMNELED
jgi:hypothetical protein